MEIVAINIIIEHYFGWSLANTDCRVRGVHTSLEPQGANATIKLWPE